MLTKWLLTLPVLAAIAKYSENNGAMLSLHSYHLCLRYNSFLEINAGFEQDSIITKSL
jgi:hypothetical protein